MSRRAIATSVGTVRRLRRDTATGAPVEIEPADPVVDVCLAAMAGARDPSSCDDQGAARQLARSDRQYRDDRDRFHALAAAANTAYAHDAATLQDAGYTVTVELQCPGFVTARVATGRETTTIDWAHASAWRFRPLVRLDGGGVMLHPLDVAVNTLLALATRREPQDLLDVLDADQHTLPFPA